MINIGQFQPIMDLETIATLQFSCVSAHVSVNQFIIAFLPHLLLYL